ncbi:MAG: Crp/Fnr family transcriptional regulator [Candidatus Eremiobacteraeota bacterium]|nr:Crp/Fnr family transcriptional regulator [Candidatus Eremiobacteraeota bacterium]MBC5827763.1 Crp/Fnr family transcriptional regulator [Candidatus Eremiobacteraeota bacterium]
MSDIPAAQALPENKVWFLRRTKLFECSGDVLIGARHLFTLKVYPRRTLLFDVGDDSRLVYFIKSGRIRISRRTSDDREIAIAILGPGDILGEEALFGQMNRTTIATCIEESLVCTSRADKLYELMSTRPAFALNFALYSSQRRSDAISVMEDIAFLPVSERLVKLFERLAYDFGVLVTSGIKLDVRLTHVDLAALIGSTRETVSLELSKLAKNGRVHISGGKFIIPNICHHDDSNSEAMTSRSRSAASVYSGRSESARS